MKRRRDLFDIRCRRRTIISSNIDFNQKGWPSGTQKGRPKRHTKRPAQRYTKRPAQRYTKRPAQRYTKTSLWCVRRPRRLSRLSIENQTKTGFVYRSAQFCVPLFQQICVPLCKQICVPLCVPLCVPFCVPICKRFVTGRLQRGTSCAAKKTLPCVIGKVFVGMFFVLPVVGSRIYDTGKSSEPYFFCRAKPAGH
jgi:hypothetical protein